MRWWSCASAWPVCRSPRRVTRRRRRRRSDPVVDDQQRHATRTATAPADSSAPATTLGVYGNPAAAAKYWQQQSLEDNCGLVSVADVVGEITGHAPTEQQMIALAESTPSQTNPGPIYAPRDDPSHTNGNGGIEMADEVVLLDHYGVKAEMTYASTPNRLDCPRSSSTSPLTAR